MPMATLPELHFLSAFDSDDDLEDGAQARAVSICCLPPHESLDQERRQVSVDAGADTVLPELQFPVTFNSKEYAVGHAAQLGTRCELTLVRHHEMDRRLSV